MRLIKLTKVYGLDDFEDIYLNVDEDHRCLLWYKDVLV